MAVTNAASVLVGLFDAQTVIGLALFAVVMYAVFHGLLASRHGADVHSTDGNRR